MRDALREINEPLRVVRVILAVLVVDSSAVEIRRLVDQVNRQPLRRLQRPQFTTQVSCSQPQIELPVHSTDAGKLFADAAIQRRDDPDSMPRLRQRLAQRADHVGQAAGLRERVNLAAGQQDFHARSSKLQIPNSKNAPNLKLQDLCPESLELGTWNLEL